MTAKKVRPNKAPTAPSSETRLDGDAAVALLAAIVNSALESSTGVVAGSAGVVTQQSSGMTATDQQNKVDVNVPELITSLNGMMMQQAVTHSKDIQALETQIIAQSSFFADLIRERAMDHADQNHTKQMLAVTFPFVVAGDAAEESAKD